MSKRIVIVGGVAAGATAAAKARRTSEQAEIVLLEAGPHVSFATCGLPYYVGGEIANRDNLFVVTPGAFRRRLNIDLRLSAKAVSVSPSERTVTVTGKSGRTEPLTYDRLILATGAVPIAPPIEGLEGPNVFTCRDVGDADAILERIGQLTPEPSPAEGWHAFHAVGIRHPFHLESLPLDDALTLLLARAEREEAGAEEQKAAAELAEELAFLPQARAGGGVRPRTAAALHLLSHGLPGTGARAPRPQPSGGGGAGRGIPVEWDCKVA